MCLCVPECMYVSNCFRSSWAWWATKSWDCDIFLRSNAYIKLRYIRFRFTRSFEKSWLLNLAAIWQRKGLCELLFLLQLNCIYCFSFSSCVDSTGRQKDSDVGSWCSRGSNLCTGMEQGRLHFSFYVFVSIQGTRKNDVYSNPFNVSEAFMSCWFSPTTAKIVGGGRLK